MSNNISQVFIVYVHYCTWDFADLKKNIWKKDNEILVGASVNLNFLVMWGVVGGSKNDLDHSSDCSANQKRASETRNVLDIFFTGWQRQKFKLFCQIFSIL